MYFPTCDGKGTEQSGLELRVVYLPNCGVRGRVD